jgi:RHS repeat-associated protein
VLGQVAAEINGCDGSVFRAYVYSAGGQLLAQQSYDGQFYWVHKDHLSSGVRLTDVNGTMIYRSVLDPYGQVLFEWAQNSETFKSSKKFTGYEREWATNLDFAEARYYHHNRGRFLQPDPMGLEAADVTAPQSLNLYSYVGNDPVNNVDPTGNFSVPFQVETTCVVLVVPFTEGGGIDGVRTVCATVMSGPVSQLDVNVELPEEEQGKTPKPPCELRADDGSDALIYSPATGFTITGGIGGRYPADQMTDATLTVFGEISSRASDTLFNEALAVASEIFNRSDAIRNGTQGTNPFGKSQSLTDVVSAPAQFDGFEQGKKTLQSGQELSGGERNCARLIFAALAVHLASRPNIGIGFRRPFLFNRSNNGGRRRLQPGQVRIGGNDFSINPM